jgi:hypothetical protein
MDRAEGKVGRRVPRQAPLVEVETEMNFSREMRQVGSNCLFLEETFCRYLASLSSSSPQYLGTQGT